MEYEHTTYGNELGNPRYRNKSRRGNGGLLDRNPEIPSWTCSQCFVVNEGKNKVCFQCGGRRPPVSELLENVQNNQGFDDNQSYMDGPSNVYYFERPRGFYTFRSFKMRIFYLFICILYKFIFFLCYIKKRTQPKI